jgi:hypothetical protein
MEIIILKMILYISYFNPSRQKNSQNHFIFVIYFIFFLNNSSHLTFITIFFAYLSFYFKLIIIYSLLKPNEVELNKLTKTLTPSLKVNFKILVAL